MAIQDIKEATETFTLQDGVDAFQETIGVNVGIGDGESAAERHSSTEVEVGESLPHPVEVAVEDGFVLQRFHLNAFFGLDLTEPVLILGLRSLRPVEVG